MAAKAVADLVHDEIGESDGAQAVAAWERIEQRVRDLTLLATSAKRVSGASVDVLEYILRTAVEELWRTPESDDVASHCGLSLAAVVEAYEDLERIGLVHLDSNMSHPSGYARACLHPAASLRVGCQLLHGVRAVVRPLRPDRGGRMVGAAHLLPWSWCADHRPVPMIAFHGAADGAAPYDGGPSWVSSRPFASIAGWTALWARRNGCAANAIESAVALDVTRIEYPDCADHASVVLYRIEGGGHTWPGGGPLPEWFVGRTSTSIDATAVLWRFFREHPLPGK
jgi:hypothetical protein